MDELNEAVGMDLLDMSFENKLEDKDIRPLFEQHQQTQSYFIKKRIVELEKLRRKKLVTNQRHLFEPGEEPQVELQRPMIKRQHHLSNSESDHDDLKKNVSSKSPIDHDLYEDVNKQVSSKTPTRDTASDNDDKKSIGSDSSESSREDLNNAGKDNIANSGMSSQQNLKKVINSEEMAEMSMAELDMDTVTSDTKTNKQNIDDNNGYDHGFTFLGIKNKKEEGERDLNDEDNIFIENELDVGVNQFVSPSKSEEDLWNRVERISANETVNDDEAKQMDIIESRSASESNSPDAHMDTDMIQNVQDSDIVIKTKPISKAKPLSMYNSDSDSDSSDAHSVSEDEIVPKPKHSNANKHDLSDYQKHFDNEDKHGEDIHNKNKFSNGSISRQSSSSSKEDSSETQEEQYRQVVKHENPSHGNDLTLLKMKEINEINNSQKETVHSLSPSIKQSQPKTHFEYLEKIEPEEVKKPLDIDDTSSSDEEPIYTDFPSSLPVINKRVTVSVNNEIQTNTFIEQKDMKHTYSDEEQETNGEKLDVFARFAASRPKMSTEVVDKSPGNNKTSETVKLQSMYGADSSDESESEELVRKAFEMEKDSKYFDKSRENGNSENEDQTSKLISNLIPVSKQEAEFDINLEDSITENSGKDYLQSKDDILNRSQHEANEYLANIQALQMEEKQPDFTDLYQVEITDPDVPVVSSSYTDNVKKVIAPAEYRDPDEISFAPKEKTRIVASVDYIEPVEIVKAQEGKKKVIAPAEYSDPEESIESEKSSDILMRFAMQPLPPLELEDPEETPASNAKTTITPEIKLNSAKVSSKETGELYTPNVQLQQEEKEDRDNDTTSEDGHRNTHPKLVRKQTEHIVLNDSVDSDDTEGLIQAAYAQEQKLSDNEEDGGDTDEADSDAENLQEQYNQAVKLKPARPVNDSESDESSASDSSSDENEEMFEATATLRETLKEDICTELPNMTQDDFKNLMDMYREERKGLKNMRDDERTRQNESLWEKLKRRKEAVDMHIHEGPTSQSTSTTGKNQNEFGVQVSPETHSQSIGSSLIEETNGEEESEQDYEEDDEVEESMVKEEELMQTVQLMDLELVQGLDGNCDSRDQLQQLLEEHFDVTEQLRRDGGATLAHHRARVKEKLRHRANNLQLPSSDSEDSCNEENTLEKDAFIDNEMGTLKESYLEAINSREEISEQELHDIIVQYREDQQELIRKRDYEKLRINEKLRLRLKEQQRRPINQQNEDENSDHDGKKEISQLDERFYEELLQRHLAGELDEEEMSLLVEEHLDYVEEFRRKIRKQMKQQKQKRNKMTESIKLREAESLILAEKEESEKIRQIRQNEKEAVNAKLQEKLKNKDNKSESHSEVPELLPRKQQPVSEHKRNRQQMADYENVQYEC